MHMCTYVVCVQMCEYGHVCVLVCWVSCVCKHMHMCMLCVCVHEFVMCACVWYLQTSMYVGVCVCGLSCARECVLCVYGMCVCTWHVCLHKHLCGAWMYVCSLCHVCAWARGACACVMWCGREAQNDRQLRKCCAHQSTHNRTHVFLF